MRPVSGILAFVAVGISASFPVRAGFYLKGGDTVLFYGDSITDSRIYTAFVEAYVLTRFPDLRVQFINSAVSGDRVTGGAAGAIDVRLRRDVLPYRPTVVTILLGMNDGGYSPFDPELFQTYSKGYESIVGTLRKALPGVRMTLLQPSPYDDITRLPKFEGGYNSILMRYGEFVRELAKREKLNTADLNTDVVNALRLANNKNPAIAQTFIPDRVHPAAAVHLLMAEALLKSWNAPPTVTAVEIDARAISVTRSENTEIRDLHGTGSLSWTQRDRSLPMPIDFSDAGVKLAVQSSDVISALNDESLRVRNLKAGKYTMTIDGEKVGTFTSEQMEDGINLAELATPMSKQASEVLLATYHHNEIHFARWRLVGFALEKYTLKRKQAASEALDRLEDEVVEAQRAAARPRLHSYELLPVTE
jgi:lysophospholipase L1-like esterase